MEGDRHAPVCVVFPGNEESHIFPIYVKPATVEELRRQVCAEAKRLEVKGAGPQENTPVFDETVCTYASVAVNGCYSVLSDPLACYSRAQTIELRTDDFAPIVVEEFMADWAPDETRTYRVCHRGACCALASDHAPQARALRLLAGCLLTSTRLLRPGRPERAQVPRSSAGHQPGRRPDPSDDQEHGSGEVLHRAHRQQ